MAVRLSAAEKAAPLFGDWQEALIWSCLQNIMGEVYADRADDPASAMALLGDFCFFAGAPNRDLILYQMERCPRELAILIPQDGRWAEMIRRVWGGRARPITRYAIKKEPHVFQREKLLAAVAALPPEYTLRMIDEAAFHLCGREDWSRDLVSQYRDYHEYRRLGLGAVVFRDGALVSGASAYARYRDGIEIEIDTKEAYRRKGLALICGAKLVLECLDRGLYPSWDAHNPASVALAEKLGYRFDHAYPAFEAAR